MANTSLPQTRNLTKEKLTPARLRPTNGRQRRNVQTYTPDERPVFSTAATFGLFALVLLTHRPKPEPTRLLDDLIARLWQVTWWAQEILLPEREDET